jgi:hypothetical protein
MIKVRVSTSADGVGKKSPNETAGCISDHLGHSRSSGSSADKM